MYGFCQFPNGHPIYPSTHNEKQRGADLRAFSQGGEKITEQGLNLADQIQEQVQKSAEDFFGNSLGSIKNQLSTQRSQLEEITQMLPESQEDGRAQLEQLLSSYEELENSLDEVAQEQGLQETVNQAAQEAQEAAGQATEQAQETAEQAQEGAEQATEQAQETAGQATEQAQGTVEQATEQGQQTAEQAQEGAGQATEQAQETSGQEQEGSNQGQ
jgi:hypothetical protein